MNIYAIRDRLVNWYIQPPFFAPGDNAAMSSLAEIINGESKHAITQAPHHFELWRLGAVDETSGNLTESREFLADCSSLVRTGIRERAEERGPDSPSGRPIRGSQSPPERTSGTTSTHPSPIQGQAPGKGPQGEIEHQGDRGSAGS